MTSVVSVSWLVATISLGSRPWAAATEASVSFGPTVTTRPSTGGITSFWPILSWSLAVSLLAHQIVIIETPVLLAIPVRVSPERTV